MALSRRNLRIARRRLALRRRSSEDDDEDEDDRLDDVEELLLLLLDMLESLLLLLDESSLRRLRAVRRFLLARVRMGIVCGFKDERGVLFTRRLRDLRWSIR